MKIELWDFNGAGVIFPAKTDLIWTNQCGGTCCTHPEMEGVFVPLNTSPEDYGEDLWIDGWGYDYKAYLKEIDEVEKLWGFLVRVSEEEFMELVGAHGWKWMGTEEMCYSCGEAWIPVKVIKPPEEGVWMSVQLEPFIGKIGILTYSNSD